MPLHLQTPFDRWTNPEPEEPTSAEDREEAKREAELIELYRPGPPQKDRRKWWGMAADCCFIVFEAGAFLLACWIFAMGLPLMFLLLLTGGQMDTMFVFLGSLFGSFDQATPDRQVAFASDAAWCLIGLATLVAAWRLPRFLDAVNGKLSHERNAS